MRSSKSCRALTFIPVKRLSLLRFTAQRGRPGVKVVGAVIIRVSCWWWFWESLPPRALSARGLSPVLPGPHSPSRVLLGPEGHPR